MNNNLKTKILKYEIRIYCQLFLKGENEHLCLVNNYAQSKWKV